VPVTAAPTEAAITTEPTDVPPAPTLPPSTNVVALEPAAAGLALAAGVLALGLALLARKVLRRGRSSVGL
jgi:hypothetical protein